MTVTVLPERQSPCRTRDDVGRLTHHCSVEHAWLVRSYHDARHAYEAAREDEAIGYPTETREYDRARDGGVTFRKWLIAMRGGGQPA